MKGGQAPDLVAIGTKADNHSDIAEAVVVSGVRVIYLKKAIACSLDKLPYLLGDPSQY